MTTKRVAVRLSDDEINMLNEALQAWAADIAVSGDDEPEGYDQLRSKLMRARTRVRVRSVSHAHLP